MIKFAVIGVALITFIYRLVLNIVQYRSANNPTPQNVADVYDTETYLKWKKYSAENSILSITFCVVSFAATLCLLFTNAYSAFASLFPETVFWGLFAVIVLETGIDTLFSIINGYISTMVIEEKYGFNRSSLKTFVFDIIRNTLLEFGLSLGMVCALWGIHKAFGDLLILLFAATLFVFSLAVSFLYPLFSRIGNKFTPLEDGELKDRLMSLLTDHGYKVKAIEVMDASRRTTKLDAYFTGFGKMKTIVLYDNLVNSMTSDEICAVFAHELGHGLHKDVLKMQIMNFGNLLIMACVVWLAVREPALHVAFGFETINYGFAYILLGLGLGLIQPLTGLVANAYSRKAEFRADRQSVKEGYGEAMITALKKLYRENFAHLAPSKLNVVLGYSHPPLAQRIEAVEKALGPQDRKASI